MNFPAEFSHGAKQGDIVVLLKQLAGKGIVSVECPISTSEGVKVADVAWISEARFKKMGGRKTLRGAPEICVEVISPSNTRNEIEDKRRLYFEAGADEVWVCERDGQMRFFLRAKPSTDAGASALCPKMAARVEGS
jgi:Uma2 family endonuclease